MTLFLNEYKILTSSTSSQGAFATVYKVRHKELGYIRAIRVLNTPITNENDKLYLKFLEECKLLLRLGNGGHPNIVRITRPRLLQNNALVEMEFIEGHDLNDYIIGECKRFVAVDEVINLASQIGSALAYCHHEIYKFCIDKDEDKCIADNDDGTNYISPECETALVEKYKVKHNDIHSKNIIRKYDGSFVLLDFGLAIKSDSVIKSSTRKGGAMEYKPPEKWEDDSIITEESDIYSFGILLYEGLAGSVPFTSATRNSTEAEYQVMQQHKHTLPPPIELKRKECFHALSQNKSRAWTKDYPDWLEKMIFKCLEKDPQKRYHNGKEFYDELQTHLESKIQLKNTILKLVDLNETLNKENTGLHEKLTSSVAIPDKKTDAAPEYFTTISFGEVNKSKGPLESQEKMLESITNELKREKKEGISKSKKIAFQREEIATLNARVSGLKTSLKNSKTWTYIASVVAVGFLGFFLVIQYFKITPTEVALTQKQDSMTVTKKIMPKPVFMDPFTGEMVVIKGGPLQMGSDELKGNIEKPVHTVVLKDFSMAKNEVTRGQWLAVMNDFKYRINDSTRNLPADSVSLYDAQRFCKQLNIKTGKKYRLPLEAEWEYAAVKNYPQALQELFLQLNDYAWNPENSNNRLARVGSKKQGASGIYDLLGNVYEWCIDKYAPYPAVKQALTPVNPPDSEPFYILRGGSGKLGFDKRLCNPKSRNSERPSSRKDFIGFRLVLTGNS